jgi:hypothetical protein
MIQEISICTIILIWSNNIHFTLFHFTSRVVFIPFKFSTTSLHFTSPHFTSLYFTTLHFTSLYFVTLRYTSLHFTFTRYFATRLLPSSLAWQKSTADQEPLLSTGAHVQPVSDPRKCHIYLYSAITHVRPSRSTCRELIITTEWCKQKFVDCKTDNLEKLEASLTKHQW